VNGRRSRGQQRESARRILAGVAGMAGVNGRRKAIVGHGMAKVGRAVAACRIDAWGSNGPVHGSGMESRRLHASRRAHGQSRNQFIPRH
jgi:hypothetical protein